MFVQSVAKRLRPAPIPTDLPAGTRVKKLSSAGTFMLARVNYMVGGQYGFQHVLVITDGDTITSPTRTARSSSSTPGRHPASPTSATGDPVAHAPDPEPSPMS